MAKVYIGLRKFGCTVLARAKDDKWLCRCACGTEFLRSTFAIASCVKIMRCRGCDFERHSVGRREHGYSPKGNQARLYKTWCGMHQRCANESNPGYQYWGARGIRVCSEWQDFAVFAVWAMAHGYADNLTIERVDNDRDYCPENCEWITRSENIARRNRREPERKKRAAMAEALLGA